MSNIKLNHLLNNKSFLLTFLILRGLLISENLCAVLDKNCCYVDDSPASYEAKDNIVKIYFKFFEYEIKHGIQNSYLTRFDVEYSSNSGKNYTDLMSASTENQTSKTWTWIDINDKHAGSKIDLCVHSYNQPKPVSTNWKDGTNPKLGVYNNPKSKNQTWISVNWFRNENQNYTTHIRIKGKWHNIGLMKTDNFELVYEINQKNTKLNSYCLNFCNSSPNQEIKNESKKNNVNAYKEPNTILVSGALNETKRTYKTSGAMVKSMLPDYDEHHIRSAVNQHYIVYIGQTHYKLAL